MRTRFALAVISLLAVFVALGSFVPMATHAAPALRPSAQNTITGTLVATPQATAPTTLLLQVGSQTIPVSISVNTQITDRNLNPLSLSTLADGDTLQVVGDFNVAGGINASLIEDLTTPVPPPPPPTYSVTVQGTLAGETNGLLCLSGAQVIGSSIRSNIATVNPCNSFLPAGSYLPVYLTGGTQFLGPSGQAITLGQLVGGDTLQASGTVANAQFTAAQVQDLTTHAAPPPPPTYSVTVQGTLAGETNGLLCLSGAQVIGSSIRPNIATVNPCNSLLPAGSYLPVYLTGTTQFLGPNGQASAGGAMRIGDTLRASGTLTNAQFTAVQVQDLTTHPAPIPPAQQVTIQGVLTNTPGTLSAPTTLCLRNAHLIGNILRVRVAGSSACPAGELPVRVVRGTRVVDRFNRVVGLYALRAGDTLEISGPVASDRFTAVRIKDFAVNRAYSTLVGTVLYVNPAAYGAYFTIRVREVSNLPVRTSVAREYGVVTVFVQGNTEIIINGTTTNQITVLNPGQVVSVMGIYNASSHHCTDTFRVRVH